jgi:hypothetical protein
MKVSGNAENPTTCFIRDSASELMDFLGDERSRDSKDVEGGEPCRERSCASGFHCAVPPDECPWSAVREVVAARNQGKLADKPLRRLWPAVCQQRS